MCTRFVYNDDDMITGFNFDIDLNIWKHKVIAEKERFYIGILRPDGTYHSYHGLNKNGNVGTLLYVHENPSGNHTDSLKNSFHTMAVSDLTEQFIKNEITFDEILSLLQTTEIVYAPDTTMQTMLSDLTGRTLIIEPGLGYRLEKRRYSLLTNYSLLDPVTTAPFIVPGDDRYERADKILSNFQSPFSVEDGLSLLRTVRQEGMWATRVSFVYSRKRQTVYYVEDNHFEHVLEYRF